MGKHFPIYSTFITRNGKKYKYYTLDLGVVDGKRKKVQRRKRADLEALRAQYRDEQKHVGERAFELGIDERLDATRALELLDGRTSLETAAKYYIKHAGGTGSKTTAGELLPLYIETKIQANRRPSTIDQARAFITHFAAAFENVPLCQISAPEILDWLKGSKTHPRAIGPYRAVLHAFFEYARKHGAVATNPVGSIPRPSSERGEIQVFTPDEVSALLSTCSHVCPDLVPYFALGIFAGLRPQNELQNLNWPNVNFQDKVIRVTPATAKNRRQRLVDMSDNLTRWLLPHRENRGTIFWSRRAYRKVRERAGVTWSSDIMRHTFGSYHLAQSRNAAETSLQMGHTTTDVLFNHYRSLVTNEQAERFWNIRPQSSGGVVMFRAS